MSGGSTKILGLSSEKIIEIIIQAVLNLIFVSALSAILTYYFSKEISKTELLVQATQAIYQNERLNAEELSRRLGVLMNQRLFNMKRLLEHYQDPQYKEDRKEYRKEYGQVLAEWNGNLSANSTQIELRFGKDMRDEFDHKIHSGFRDVHKEFAELVEKLQQKRITESEFKSFLAAMKPKIQEISKDIDIFNEHMMMAIKENKIGSKLDQRKEGGLDQ